LLILPELRNYAFLWRNSLSTKRGRMPAPIPLQGAFAHIVVSLHKELNGGAAPCGVVKFYGKPHAEPYRLAERLLVAQAVHMGLVPADHPAAVSQHHTAAASNASVTHHHNNGSGHHSNSYSSSHHNEHRDARGLPFSGIFAVGDNPAADVRGANLAGPPWVSVLVRTGGCGWVRYKGGVHVQSAMTLQGQLELRSSS
jgi:ribonucleotide monophosphatase NagD (HAD superfamily)